MKYSPKNNVQNGLITPPSSAEIDGEEIHINKSSELTPQESINKILHILKARDINYIKVDVKDSNLEELYLGLDEQGVKVKETLTKHSGIIELTIMPTSPLHKVLSDNTKIKILNSLELINPHIDYTPQGDFEGELPRLGKVIESDGGLTWIPRNRGVPVMVLEVAVSQSQDSLLNRTCEWFQFEKDDTTIPVVVLVHVDMESRTGERAPKLVDNRVTNVNFEVLVRDQLNRAADDIQDGSWPMIGDLVHFSAVNARIIYGHEGDFEIEFVQSNPYTPQFENATNVAPNTISIPRYTIEPGPERDNSNIIILGERQIRDICYDSIVFHENEARTAERAGRAERGGGRNFRG